MIVVRFILILLHVVSAHVDDLTLGISLSCEYRISPESLVESWLSMLVFKSSFEHFKFLFH